MAVKRRWKRVGSSVRAQSPREASRGPRSAQGNSRAEDGAVGSAAADVAVDLPVIAAAMGAVGAEQRLRCARWRCAGFGVRRGGGRLVRLGFRAPGNREERRDARRSAGMTRRVPLRRARCIARNLPIPCSHVTHEAARDHAVWENVGMRERARMKASDDRAMREVHATLRGWAGSYASPHRALRCLLVGCAAIANLGDAETTSDQTDAKAGSRAERAERAEPRAPAAPRAPAERRAPAAPRAPAEPRAPAAPLGRFGRADDGSRHGLRACMCGSEEAPRRAVLCSHRLLQRRLRRAI